MICVANDARSSFLTLPDIGGTSDPTAVAVIENIADPEEARNLAEVFDVVAWFI